MVAIPVGKGLAVSYEVKHTRTIQPAILLLSVYLREMKTMFIKGHKRSYKDGSNIGGSGVHFPSTPGKYLADLRSRANSQQYSSIYEDQRPKIEDIERSDGKKSA